MTRESAVEDYFVLAVEGRGGRAEKFKIPGRNAAPDRLVLWPGGRAQFVELKRADTFATPAQERDHARRRAMGFRVDVLGTFEDVDRWIRLHSYERGDG
jgi:hypothetical protein